MNFKEKLISVLELLNLKQKFESKTLSNEEFNSLVAEYSKKYQVTLNDDLAAEQAAKKTAAQAEEFQRTLNAIQEVLVGSAPAATVDNEEGTQPVQQANASVEKIIEGINGLRAEVKELAAQPTPDVPAQTVTSAPVSINGFSNTPTYLFGIEHPMFSMTDRWNKIAANPRAAAALPEVDEQMDGVAFHKAACQYAKSLKNRYQYLQ